MAKCFAASLAWQHFRRTGQLRNGPRVVVGTISLRQTRNVANHQNQIDEHWSLEGPPRDYPGA